MQNFFSGMAGGGGGGEAGGAAPGPNDDTPIWMKYAAKGAGVVGGGFAVFLGVWCCITIFPMCIVAGIWQILSGLVVIFVEAPFCAPFCGQFIPPLAKFTQIVEARPPWQRAAVYLVISLPPMLLCPAWYTIIGSGLVFAVSVLYAMMSLGKKASREEMSAAASMGKSESIQSGMKSGLVGNIQGQDVEAAKQGGKS